MDGKEYSLDAVIIINKVEFLHIRDKILTKSLYRKELQYVSPANISAYTYEKIYNTLFKFVL